MMFNNIKVKLQKQLARKFINTTECLFDLFTEEEMEGMSNDGWCGSRWVDSEVIALER